MPPCPVTTTEEAPFDWAEAARLFSRIESELFHHTPGWSQRPGEELTAEALRRVWERIGHGWVRTDYMHRVLETNRGVDRANGEQAQATLAHLTAEYQEKMANSAREYAAALRARCNERTVPARLRREGVLLAADWLEGK